MRNAPSKPTTDNNGGNASAHSVPAGRVNIRMVQNNFLIWFDPNIDESSADCQNTIPCLGRVMNAIIHTYTDSDQCIQFLKQVQDDKVHMVVSGAFSKDFVNCVHDMSQVDSIFILCDNKQYHELWAKDWSKVKGVYTDIRMICDALKQSIEDCEQNAIGFSLVASSGDCSNMNLDRLDPMFMYTQITKEILLEIPFEQKHILDFTKYCREVLLDNQYQLNKVDKFEQDYQKRTPIYWYTLESFLYPMLNRALRLSDMDVIVKMGFLIGDLHREIEVMHQQQYGGSNAEKQFTVYRGVGMSKEELEKVSKTKGGLIAFNSFLSTSGTEAIAMRFAKSALCNPEMMGVVFEMKVVPGHSTTPFASVAAVSAYDTEDEVLFSMHTVFRIRDIQPVGRNARLFRVKLELTSDNDQDLQMLTERIREETYPDLKGWYRLGSLLLKLGKYNSAEETFKTMLEQATDATEKVSLYHMLGNVKYNLGEYMEAIKFFERSIEIQQTEPSSRYSDLIASYNSLAVVYEMMGEHIKALKYHEKALATSQTTVPLYSNPFLNPGETLDERSMLIQSFNNTMKILLQIYPEDDLFLASEYDRYGSVCKALGAHNEARAFYEHALKIKQKRLSPIHPSLADTLANCADVVEDPATAHTYRQQAIKIRQLALPKNHPDRQTHEQPNS